MRLPEPFVYEADPHQRRHGPLGYADYGGYKDWLRDEAIFRCVYCLERETWYPDRSASFSIDHAVPQGQDMSLVCDYENLVYACTRCNSSRRDVPVLDPTKTGFGQHLRVDDEGRIHGLTPEGLDLIDLLFLNDYPALDVRQHILSILADKEAHPDDPTTHEVFAGAFRYPKDLPNLRALRPPGGNTRPEGVEDCHYERRKRGELSEFY